MPKAINTSLIKILICFSISENDPDFFNISYQLSYLTEVEKYNLYKDNN